ncbi:MAG: hypothetical protein LBV77_00420 [Candidatus Adiutrix intracellularis]|nr:hypothetical protein [Candidatus Adiutrix intracellularis]
MELNLTCTIHRSATQVTSATTESTETYDFVGDNNSAGLPRLPMINT